MSLAKIIAPLTGNARDTIVLQTAFAAARPFAAHVVGLVVRPDPRLAMPYMGAPLSPGVIQAVLDSVQAVSRGAAKAARAALGEAAAAAGIEILADPRKSDAVTCSYREVEGVFARAVAQEAQLSDLIVFGPIGAADSPELADAFVETLLKTERPVLIAPHAPASIGTKVALAWDGSAVAARALIGALPYCRRAHSVTLLTCQPTGSPRPAFATLENYLALHGIAGTHKIVDSQRHSIGETLLASAAGCDLLVMGGYGHSRLGESVFGGVTEYVRWHATLPVLMVH
jgi:nucleotide-binding universal stress UspA family protein